MEQKIKYLHKCTCCGRGMPVPQICADCLEDMITLETNDSGIDEVLKYDVPKQNNVVPLRHGQ
jgi:primosomal protein N'